MEIVEKIIALETALQHCEGISLSLQLKLYQRILKTQLN